jgi:glutathione S-transferase
MIIVHHLENSRSQRILWLLEELAVPYEVKRYARNPETSLAPDELTAIHPLGKSPIITDGDTVVAESGTIIEYLVGKYGDGRLVPEEGSEDKLAYTYFMHYAEGSFMPLMILSLIMARIEAAPVPFFLKPLTRGIANKVRDGYLTESVRRNLDFLESSLSDSAWFAGDTFTAADVQMSFAVEAAAVRHDLGNDYPHLATFLETVRARPAYQAALEKGGPYALLGS